MLAALLVLAGAPALAETDELTPLDLLAINACNSSMIPTIAADLTVIDAYFEYMDNFDQYKANGVIFEAFAASKMNAAEEAAQGLEYETCYVNDIAEIPCEDAAAFLEESGVYEYDGFLAALDRMYITSCVGLELEATMTGDEEPAVFVLLAGFNGEAYQFITELPFTQPDEE